MSFAISSEKNSTIYQNPDPQDLIDFSFLGVMEKIDNDVIIEQQNHLLRVTDAIYMMLNLKNVLLIMQKIIYNVKFVL